MKNKYHNLKKKEKTHENEAQGNIFLDINIPFETEIKIIRKCKIIMNDEIFDKLL